MLSENQIEVAPQRFCGLLAVTSWRHLFSMLLSLLVLGAHSAARADSSVSKEYKLKAAFLYNFAKFVDWPAQSFPSADSPIVIGVVGASPFGAELEKVVHGRKINGRNVVVTLVQTASAARQTHLLFIGAAEDSRLNELLGTLKGVPVLTVGESESFVRQGGMITFSLQSDKLRFQINIDTTKTAGLDISAQLQKLATEIRR